MQTSSEISFFQGGTVRHWRGGPIMTVDLEVGHLLLCSWLDANSRVKRQTFSPNELVAAAPEHLSWLHALVCLSSRYRVIAMC